MIKKGGQLMSDKVTVENIVDGAIIEGFKNGVNMFMEDIENDLRKDIVITEAGGAETMLQSMIDNVQNTKKEDEIIKEAEDLSAKIAAVI